MKTYSTFVKIGFIGLFILFIVSGHAESTKGESENKVSQVINPTPNSPSAAGEIYGIKITDWIQAFGSLIAVIGVLVGFIKLYTDNRKQKTQIDSLMILAQQSEIQSNHLSHQVDQMIEGNNLQLQYISCFQDFVQISNQSIKLNVDKDILDRKKRKLEIKPFFEFGTLRRDPDSIIFALSNHGQIATINNFEILEGNSMNSNIDRYIGKDIIHNGTLVLNLTPGPIGITILYCNLNLRIIYSDIDGNTYCQIIEGKGSDSFRVHKQLELC